MPLFQPKHVEIEAEQYTDALWPPGVCDCAALADEHAHGKQGPVKVNLMDWIIKEMDGSGYYPCAPDIFAKRWVAVDNGGPVEPPPVHHRPASCD